MTDFLGREIYFPEFSRENFERKKKENSRKKARLFLGKILPWIKSEKKTGPAERFFFGKEAKERKGGKEGNLICSKVSFGNETFSPKKAPPY